MTAQCPQGNYRGQIIISETDLVLINSKKSERMLYSLRMGKEASNDI
jgi:hypothetical protein